MNPSEYFMGPRLRLKLLFGYPFGQSGLDALLKIIPAGRHMDVMGGVEKHPGTALLSPCVETPSSIWCVVPRVWTAQQSEPLFCRALAEGFKCSDVNGFRNIALSMDARSAVLTSWQAESVFIISELVRFGRTAAHVQEVRMYASDSRLLAQLRSEVERQLNNSIPVKA